MKKVERHLQDAVSKGGKILIGGEKSKIGELYFQPTVLTNLSENMIIFEEETFGPLAPLFKFKDENEVIRMANATNYGLAGYILRKI